MPREDWETDEDGNTIIENLAPPTIRRAEYHEVARVIRTGELTERDLIGWRVVTAAMARNGLAMILENPMSSPSRRTVTISNGGNGDYLNRVTCSRYGDLVGCTIRNFRIRYNGPRRRNNRGWTVRRPFRFVVDTQNGERREVGGNFISEGRNSLELRAHATIAA